jgi:hypothetical protein
MSALWKTLWKTPGEMGWRHQQPSQGGVVYQYEGCILGAEALSGVLRGKEAEGTRLMEPGRMFDSWGLAQ